ncbi:Uncharacterised protein [Mycobacteroides abscessus subsp. abscessus]|nr:Uncharacterised protein [Mycobacteroides abscessus subsp. abscessus]
MELNSRLPTVTATATTVELEKYRPKGRSKRRWKLSQVGLSGHQVGGTASSSPWVFNEPSSIHANGVMTITSSADITRYSHHRPRGSVTELMTAPPVRGSVGTG